MCQNDECFGFCFGEGERGIDAVGGGEGVGERGAVSNNGGGDTTGEAETGAGVYDVGVLLSVDADRLIEVAGRGDAAVRKSHDRRAKLMLGIERFQADIPAGSVRWWLAQPNLAACGNACAGDGVIGKDF